MSQLPQSSTNIQDAIEAFFDGRSTGVNLRDVQQHLSTVLDEVPDLETIQSHLNEAIDKGLVETRKVYYLNYLAEESSQSRMSSVNKKTRSGENSEKDKIKQSPKKAEKRSQNAMSSVDEKTRSGLDSGKDKIKESAKKRSQNKMSSVDEKTRSGVDSGKDKIKKYAKNAKEVVKDAKSNFEEEFNANQGKEENGKIGARAADENMISGSNSRKRKFVKKKDNTTSKKSVKEDK